HLILDNVTGTPSSNAVFTTPIVGLLGKTTGLAPATIYHSASGGAYSHGSSDGVLVLGSNKGPNLFNVMGDLAGSTYQFEGGTFADSFNVGDTHTGNAGNLDLVQGLVTVVGNGGSD